MTNNPTSTPRRHAVVVGAGVAGLTAATQLARDGWQVEVLERGTALRTGGYKVDVRGAALTVLHRMGLSEQVKSQHLGIRAGSIVTADGQTVAQMGGDTFGGREGGDVEVERGTLVALLADAAIAAGATITYGAAVTSVSSSSHPGEPTVATVRLATGEERRADIVIGADGLRSAVRSAVVGDADVVRDLGYGIAVHPTTVNPGLEREEATYVSAGRTALVYDTGHSTRAMYLFSRTDPLPRDREGALAYLKERYAGQSWIVPDLLADAESTEEIYLDAMAQVVAPAWSHGRIVLVGDAAWCATPASGQGTSLALVGGYVLACRLHDAGDAESGLMAYESALRPFVERNQRLGPINVKRMVLSSERSVRSTLRLLLLLHRLPFSEAIMAQAMKPLHNAANAIDVDEAAGRPAPPTGHRDE